MGVNDGAYPLGSCTMKYNPKVNDEAASLPGFTRVHPLQPEETVQGCLHVLHDAEKIFCEITGMDAMTFQPAAGAHGGNLPGCFSYGPFMKAGETADGPKSSFRIPLMEPILPVRSWRATRW